MDPVKGGARYGVPQGGTPAVAAGKAVMERDGQAAGWDPFEVWRTRVRDVQQARARDTGPAGKR